jgi:demethylmenaquinone methyltransferase/2-methoxy-6-polyprenyl-1,4-benzoquinol methylase
VNAPPTTTELATLGSGEMFDRIARRYDFVNRVLSLGLDQRWRRRTVAAVGVGIGESPRILDVATGTGDLAIALATAYPRGMVIGLDPSPGMLAIAAQKVARRGMHVELVRGDAQDLPHASCSIDAATIAFGIRNVPDRPRALRELARVVRPGGRIAILELSEPRKGVMASAARFHTHHLVPRIGALLSGKREYAYLQKSVAAFPPADEFAQMMRGAGLTVVEVVPLTFGACTLFVATPTEDA